MHGHYLHCVTKKNRENKWNSRKGKETIDSSAMVGLRKRAFWGQRYNSCYHRNDNAINTLVGTSTNKNAFFSPSVITVFQKFNSIFIMFRFPFCSKFKAQKSQSKFRTGRDATLRDGFAWRNRINENTETERNNVKLARARVTST